LFLEVVRRVHSVVEITVDSFPVFGLFVDERKINRRKKEEEKAMPRPVEIRTCFKRAETSQ
jgi:hypothetical protein